jgi:hypothetical protein
MTLGGDPLTPDDPTSSGPDTGATDTEAIA